MVCPTGGDAHGPLIAWANHPRWGWWCPAQAHDGHRDRPQTRAFFTTEEAENGLPDQAARSAAAEPAPSVDGLHRQPDQQLTGAPELGSAGVSPSSTPAAAAGRSPQPTPSGAAMPGNTSTTAYPARPTGEVVQLVLPAPAP